MADDLSADADRALAVLMAVEWPPGTVVRLVTSLGGVGRELGSFAAPEELRAHAEHVRATVVARHERAAMRLADAGTLVATAILPGPPAAAVVKDARAFRADLVVAGARAQSPLARTLLGSVSAAITEDARCSVLIARVESFARVLLATDGSAGAQAATDVVATWPLFAGREVRVVSVVPAQADHGPSSAPGLGIADPIPTADGAPDAERQGRAGLAAVDRALDRLAAHGRPATGHVRVGQPADQIVAAAREWPADVVVVGSSGKSFLRRLILGSVARGVLNSVQSSVLIVRPRRGGSGQADPRAHAT